MKFCRFQPLEFAALDIHRSTGLLHAEPRWGVIEKERVREIQGGLLELAGESHGGWAEGPPRGSLPESGRAWPLNEVKLLPPSVPSKIVCLGRNYVEHAAELGNAVPTNPLIFLKPPSSVIAAEEPIVIPPDSKRVDYEGELAVIIGRACSHLGPADDVKRYIAGYTCLNDVTARDLQKADVQFTRGKGFDTFCPIGPVLETELDLATAKVETYLNGVRKQSALLAEMIFSVDAIIRWISRVMTLVPGDVIATGTPSGVGPLTAGDVVEVMVSGIGTLRNPVVAGDE
jgi:2-keto-4-pentenoate hydratase/2-oxohepta-3-ene-1,7-dioic acid hydratase in catechol pathway